MGETVLWIGIGYLVGSIPFGLLLVAGTGGGDIRTQGSGNIGATNVLRSGHKSLALMTLALDAIKGSGVVIAAQSITSPTVALIAGTATVFGHCFPVWLRFKGGKGVATTFGILLVALPWVGLSAACIWLGMAALFRFSSLAALTAIGATPILAFLTYPSFPGTSLPNESMEIAPMDGPTLGIPTVLCSLIVCLTVWRHKGNIYRLWTKTESRIGQSKG